MAHPALCSYQWVWPALRHTVGAKDSLFNVTTELLVFSFFCGRNIVREETHTTECVPRRDFRRVKTAYEIPKPNESLFFYWKYLTGISDFTGHWFLSYRVYGY